MFESYIRGVFYYNYSSCHQLHTVALSFLPYAAGKQQLEGKMPKIGHFHFTNRSQRAHVHCFSTERSNEERGYIIDAVSELKNGRLFIDDSPAISVEYMRERCREVQRNQNIWLIVVDYLQLMHMDGFETCREMLNQIARELKMIAIEYNCPVVLLSQLNRSVESRADHHPMLSDIRDASELEEIADEVLFLYRDDYYHCDSDEKGTAELQVAKCSHGNINRIKLTYMPEYSIFSDLE